jgi:hypothetical protein
VAVLCILIGFAFSLNNSVSDIRIQAAISEKKLSDRMSVFEEKLSGMDAKIQAVLDALQATPPRVAAPLSAPSAHPPVSPPRPVPGNAGMESQ